MKKGERVKYTLRRCKVKFYTMPKGQDNFTVEGLFTGNISPARFLIGFTRTRDKNGFRKTRLGDCVTETFRPPKCNFFKYA